MKLFKILSVLLFSLILTSCQGQSKNKKTTNNDQVNKIEVIDFHSTRRCITCNAIEASTKYTLDTYFSEELKEGIISFKVINVDEKENKVISENFEASGTALFLNVIKNGKENHIDLTNFAFMKGKDKEAFSIELKSKIENQLLTL